MLWKPGENHEVDCGLCAHRCRIEEGQSGICRVRFNDGGTLKPLTLNRLVSATADPIEKKPLFHFQPGTSSYSVATVGCNFHCAFCQNWQISQHVRDHGSIPGKVTPPADVVTAALGSNCSSIAYTYTEPTIYFETCHAIGTLARAAGLKNVFVTNGYMTSETVEAAKDFLDGANVDLKGFRDTSYRKTCGAGLEGVLDGIRSLHGAGVWLEVTTLVVPGFNDTNDELRDIARFLVDLSPEIPWHISRYHPDYKMDKGGPTPMETLRRAFEIGREEGLRFVYLGNAPGDPSESTFCPNCGKIVIGRVGFTLTSKELEGGLCAHCGEKIPGVWH